MQFRGQWSSDFARIGAAEPTGDGLILAAISTKTLPHDVRFRTDSLNQSSGYIPKRSRHFPENSDVSKCPVLLRSLSSTPVYRDSMFGWLRRWYQACGFGTARVWLPKGTIPTSPFISVCDMNDFWLGMMCGGFLMTMVRNELVRRAVFDVLWLTVHVTIVLAAFFVRGTSATGKAMMGADES